MKIGLSLAIVDPKGSGVIAALNEDFTNGAVSLDPLITFSRASSATYFDSTGILQTAGSGVARAHAFQDHNPSTLAPLGFLIEEQRTNSIRNNTMVGAAAGTPGTLPTNWGVSGLGTLTQQIVGTGTANGITYIDVRFSGTTSTTTLSLVFDGSTVIAAANGQTWAQSIWTAVVAGSTANITTTQNSANLFDSGGVYLANINYATPNFNTTSVLTRSSSVGTISTVGTAFIRPILALAFASGVAIDITLRIGLPQLELGAFATSVIATTTAAATRLADSASITGTNFSQWYNQTEGTFVTQFSAYALGTGVNRRLWNADDGTLNERYSAFIDNGSAVNYVVQVGGVDQANLVAAPTLTVNTTAKSAQSYKAADFAACVNGGTVLTDLFGTLPTVNVFRFGNFSVGTNQLSGHIQRLSYYRSRLSDASLQSLST